MLDMLLLPLFLIASAIPYLGYFLLRRMGTKEERDNLKEWG